MTAEIDKMKTNYIKGLVIAIVMINHYFDFHILQSNINICNTLLAPLFILSGIGIYYYFGKKHDQGIRFFKIIKVFYFSRFIKIYPLFILTLLIIYGRKLSALNYLVIVAPGIYWFVCAIFHCYLLAPFLFMILKKMSVAKYILFSSFFFLLSGMIMIFFADHLPELLRFKPFVFMGLPLSHIWLFSIGLSVPEILKIKNIDLLGRDNFYLFTALMILFVLTKEFVPGAILSLTLSLLLLPVFIFFIIKYLRLDTKPVFSKQFAFLGKYIYPLYLFHVVYFAVLFHLGLIEDGHLSGLLYVILFFPAFLAICVYTGKAYDAAIYRKLAR